MRKNLLALAVATMSCGMMQAQRLTFPGAEGYGAYATGGKGGTVVHVTNLNASGTGSLADAVSQPNRIVVFDVGGVIDITNGSITIASNVTIAGQTAPGEGITIYGGRVIASDNSNIIIRYVRMRGGIALNQKKCTLTLDNCSNVILDHCSISWGRWDNVHITNAKDITWQNCIISEGIDPQRFGAITDGTTNWTIAHCLWADNKSRNPKMKCGVQYYNNVVYNYASAVIGGHSAADHYQDVINNYFIMGPSSGSTNKYFDQWTTTDHLYSTGNYTDGDRDGVLNGTLITDYNDATPMSSPNFNTSHPMNLKTAEEAYYDVVEHVGASRVRDEHDKRIVEQLVSLGTKGAFIDNENDVGGIGTLTGGSALQDTDNDGMPDEWEDANGTDKTKNDANGDVNGDGYSNIEKYINSLAHKSDYLMPPSGLKATVVGGTSVTLTWVNSEKDVTSTMVEQSENGEEYVQVATVEGNETSCVINGLQAKKIYYFRLKAVKGDKVSGYSDAVSVNDDGMRANGGTPAGTAVFVPEDGKLYRIINYATKAYNSGTTLDGVAKYMKFADNGALVGTETFAWDDPSLLWEIKRVANDSSSYTLRNKATGKYFTATNVSIDGTDRIGSVDTAAVFNIVYVGNGLAGKSGLTDSLSLYRINSPASKNQQIRAKNFPDTWIWGSGTYSRADMVFTFSEIDASLVKVYLSNLRSVVETAESLLGSAVAGNVTLGYPAAVYDKFAGMVSDAKTFLGSVNKNEATQEQIDSVAKTIAEAMTEFKKEQIMVFAGYETSAVYNIYSYGTRSNASATTADTNTERRYLATMKTADGVRDSLIYKVGLSDAAIDGGATDSISQMAEAQWTISPAANGCAYVVNVKTGTYMKVDNYLSGEAVSVYPYYAKEDNGKHAFYIEESDTVNRCFNVGIADSDGLQGPLVFASPADRTRLRWVFEEVDAATTAIEGIGAEPTTCKVTSRKLYSLQGVELPAASPKGLFVERVVYEDGKVRSRVVLGR